MPCIGTAGLNEVQKKERATLQEERLQDLEQSLMKGRITLAGPADKPVFDGWDADQRGDWCDGCAYRALMSRGSSALRMAAARQQSMGQGRMTRGAQ